MTVATNYGTQDMLKGSLQSIDTIGTAPSHRLSFQFNPSTISETRGVEYNFSESQGQSLPLAQFGRLANTKISFELFMFSHNGLDSSIKSLRRLTLPRQVSKLTYYEQTQPHKYHLYLGAYGDFIGVVTSIDINTRQFSKSHLSPINLSASIEFVVVSGSLGYDVGHMKSIGGL